MTDLETLYQIILLIIVSILILFFWKKLSDAGIALPY